MTHFKNHPWQIAIILTLLLHFAIFFTPWSQLLPPLHLFKTPMAPVEIKKIDPEIIDQIKNQWKTKKLILQNEIKNESKLPNPDARYFSEKTQTVKKETQSTHSQILPSPFNQPTSINLKRLALPIQSHSNVKISTANQNRQSHSFQNINDPQLDYSAETLLNTQESIYYSYYSRLYRSIGPIWQSKIRDTPQSSYAFQNNQNFQIPEGEYVSIVDVIFDSNGNLYQIQFLKSSQIQSFDQAIIDSWKKIKSFPNPPQSLIQNDGKVHTQWSFTVSVNKNSGLFYQPPELRQNQ